MALPLSPLGLPAATLHVWLDAPGSVSPYTNWATAARTIQAAVDAAAADDTVLVTNGVYASGGRAVYGITNRVAIDKPIVLQSVNGPAVTLIVGAKAPGTPGGLGAGAVRCAYVGTNAVLSGFTLTNGHTQPGGDAFGGGAFCEVSGMLSNCVLTGNNAHSGGGVYRGTLNNCTLTNNSADWYDGGGANRSTLNNCMLIDNWANYQGGGADSSILNNCTLTANWSQEYGGGVSWGTLNNCVLTGNSAGQEGGGAFECLLNNCIVYYNTASFGPNFSWSTFNYSCTTPLPTGAGNLAQEPRFVNTNGWSDLRLQSNSPCINAGFNGYVLSAADLDGNPRITGGTVDIGAYEFQSPASVLSHGWLQQFGLPMDGSGDHEDPDRDGLNNWAEWRSGTDPTNALSVLRLRMPERAGSSVTLSWSGVSDRNYRLEWSTNLLATPPFQPLATNLAGQLGTLSYTDTNAVGSSSRFYRLGVE